MKQTSGYYLKEWKKALQAEIQHLKNYGSNKYRITEGRLLSSDGSFTYYFDTTTSIKVPNGSNIRLEWGGIKVEGRILSSEGHSVIVSVNENLGDLLTELFLFHDPWELLDQLFQRLADLKENKKKRARILRLMDPSMSAKHPTDHLKSNVHELILRSKYNPVTFVWGPPGTGKTYTLARVAANKYFKGKRVLVLAHSNQAVDVLMAEISSFVDKKGRFREGDLLRYGLQVGEALLNQHSLTTSQLIQKHHPHLAEEKDTLIEERKNLKHDLSRSFSVRDSEKLLDIETKLGNVFEKIRSKEIEFVKEADIIGTTLAKAAGDPAIYEKEFDLVILDEASMAYVPQTGFAATLAKRVIVCGDFKQLPPIAVARHPLVEQWLKEDIFHRAGIVEWVKNGKLHPHLFLLKEQRRMHPDISAFTNRYIYQSLVSDHETVLQARQGIVERQPFPNRASILVDTTGTGENTIREKSSNSRINLWQLLLSFQLIHESYLAGNRSIGYVTPYRAQAILMEQLLNEVYTSELQQADIIAATVHRFQGSERDVMIFDTVDSYPEERAGMLLTGKDSERLLNVAITRTKGKFIQVSDRSFIRKNVFKSKILRLLVEHQISNNQMVTPPQIGSWIKNQHPKLQWMHAKKLEGVKEDIRSAKSSILISLPDGGHLSKEWIEMLNDRGRVKLTLLAKESHIKADKQTDCALPFPFVMIDQQILWLGLPVEAGKRLEPPYVTARLESQSVCSFLLSQISQES